MKTMILTALAFFLSLSLNAQKYMTKNGYIGFFSTTPIEDIKADNNQVAAILDVSNGELVFQALMKSFKFEKALMEEHFNENYVESEKYPRASFKGKILNPADVNFSKPGVYKVNVSGDLTIHGVTRSITEPGELEVTAAGINAKSKFPVKPEDYNIVIPSVVREKIAREISVTVDVKMAKMAE